MGKKKNKKHRGIDGLSQHWQYWKRLMRLMGAMPEDGVWQYVTPDFVPHGRRNHKEQHRFMVKMGNADISTKGLQLKQGLEQWVDGWLLDGHLLDS